MATIADLITAVKNAKTTLKQAETAYGIAVKNRESAKAAVDAAVSALMDAVNALTNS